MFKNILAGLGNFPISCGDNPLYPPLLRGNRGRDYLFSIRYWVITGIALISLLLTVTTGISFADIEVGENLRLFGDFRFRYELDVQSGTQNIRDSRERPALRTRVGAKYQSHWEPLSFGIRLVSANDKLASSDQEFDMLVANGFSLDRAFLKLAFWETGAVIIGKQGFPLWQQTEQFWDEDIQPGGYTFTYTVPLAAMGDLSGTAGYYYIENNDWARGFFDNDALTAWQLLYKGRFEKVKLVFALSGVRIIDGDEDNDAIPVGSFFVGKFPDPVFYMLSGQIEFKMTKKKGMPDSYLFGIDQYFSSWVEPNRKNVTGYVVQIRMKFDKIGFRLYYYDIQEAGVPFFGDFTFAQDNFSSSRDGGITGFEGHRLQLDYQISENINTDIRVYLSEGKFNNSYTFSEQINRDIARFQFNFNMKF